MDGPFETVLENKWGVDPAAKAQLIRHGNQLISLQAQGKTAWDGLWGTIKWKEYNSEEKPNDPRPLRTQFYSDLNDRLEAELGDAWQHDRKNQNFFAKHQAILLNITWEHLQQKKTHRGQELDAEEYNTETKESHVTWLITQEQTFGQLIRSIREANWALLNARYPRYITSDDLVFAMHVNSRDQSFRQYAAVAGLLVFVFIGLASNLNTSCLHGVYRDEIADIWLKDREMKLKDLSSSENGGPIHLINATLNHLSTLGGSRSGTTLKISLQPALLRLQFDGLSRDSSVRLRRDNSGRCRGHLGSGRHEQHGRKPPVSHRADAHELPAWPMGQESGSISRGSLLALAYPRFGELAVECPGAPVLFRQ